MRRITLSAVLLGLVALAAGAEAGTPLPTPIAAVQPSCPAAPAVASAYLKEQAGKKLTMTRAAILADITKNTGADGMFAGLKPCDSGYASAVHFYMDEVLKVGTNNSTP
jgi:hypothetical protein